MTEPKTYSSPRVTQANSVVMDLVDSQLDSLVSEGKRISPRYLNAL